MTSKTISHYKIIKEIGRGGMGVVYKAQDTKLTRPVALKFLHSGSLQDNTNKTRMLLEAQAAAVINHPNICTIYEIDEVDDNIFIAMEFIEGQTLKTLIPPYPPLLKGESGGLFLDNILNYAIQIAEGLQAIHEKGMVHRDIKSDNILITDKGQVKIMDFGLVKLSWAKEHITQSGTTLGTVAYMSPEQTRGGEIDNRSDIWSLGVILYEMITGQLPFCGEYSVAIIYSILNDDYGPVSCLRPDVPQYLENVISKALTKDPDDRYQNIKDVLTDLKNPPKKIEPKIATEKTSEKKAKPSIVVLPFMNMSADPEQEYFCDGITEEIINALTNIGSLQVVARTSAFYFKGKDLKIQDIGRELNVDTVLEGSVRKSGNRIRITGQLINVSDGYHIWSDKFDRDMEDIFEIQDEISLAIAETLKIKLLKREKEAVVKRHTDDHEAYELYLQGNYFWNERTEAGYQKAIEYFQKAVKVDPDYTRALVGIAKGYFALALYFMDPRIAIPEAEAAARKALEIDDTIGELHGVYGVIRLYYYEWEQGLRYCKRAVILGPQDVYAYHVYSNILLVTRKFSKAIDIIQQAVKLDPLSLNLISVEGLTLLLAGRHDEAIQKYHKVLEMDPNFQHSLWGLGMAYSSKSMIEKAIQSYQKFFILSNKSPMATGFLGYAYGMAGCRDDATQMLNHLDILSEKQYVSPFYRALIHMGFGNIDQTLKYLEISITEHAMIFSFMYLGSIFKPIYTEPRYKALLKKVNLEKYISSNDENN